MPAGELWKKVSGFGKNIAKNSKSGNYVSRMVKFGAIGGVVGGAAEAAQGGSFVEGAKSGAFTGAAVGAGYTAFKAGRIDSAKRVNFTGSLKDLKYRTVRRGGSTVKAAGEAGADAVHQAAAGAASAEKAASQAAGTVTQTNKWQREQVSNWGNLASGGGIVGDKGSRGSWFNLKARTRGVNDYKGMSQKVASDSAAVMAAKKGYITAVDKNGRYGVSKQVTAIQRNHYDAQTAQSIMDSSAYERYKKGLF
jgi:hypothetical protein